MSEKITPDKIHFIRELTLNGLTSKGISLRLGIPRGVVTRYRKILGIQSRYTRVSEEILAKIRYLTQEGWSSSQISRELGVAKGTVLFHRKLHNIIPPAKTIEEMLAKKREYRRKWKAEHPEKVLEYRKKYQKVNVNPYWEGRCHGCEILLEYGGNGNHLYCEDCANERGII